jgi:hypothetical protein
MQAPDNPGQAMNGQESGRQLRAGPHSAITKPAGRPASQNDGEFPLHKARAAFECGLENKIR